MFKLAVIAAIFAVASAGYAPVAAPLAYAAAPVAVHAPAIGASHQSTVRTLDGNSAVSHYSKAVDSAFSSVRKYDTRISNDAVAYAPAYGAAYHAPAVAAYHAPAVAAYHAPAVAAYHAPAVAAHGLVGTAYSAAPAVAHLAFDGFGVHYGY